MLYRPSKGKMKDDFIVYYEGRYYMFCMYGPDIDHYNSVWLATSEDGVHWKDYGVVIQAPFIVWAMAILRVGDRFIMNHGSFTPKGVQGVLKQWESHDLLHWRYLGEEYDVLPPPDIEDARIDHMAAIPEEERGETVYYGYPASPYMVLRSKDGLKWDFIGTADQCIDWGDVPPTLVEAKDAPLETGAAMRIGETYY